VAAPSVPEYSDEKLGCNGRACHNCDKCRDWYFTGDATTWKWIQNWKNWDRNDKERWQKNANGVQNQFKKREGSMCLWVSDHLRLHPWVNNGFLGDDPEHPSQVTPKQMDDFLSLPTCNDGSISHAGCMCLNNLNP
jgi:hypothetical protein